eukprot:UN16725
MQGLRKIYLDKYFGLGLPKSPDKEIFCAIRPRAAAIKNSQNDSGPFWSTLIIPDSCKNLAKCSNYI